MAEEKRVEIICSCCGADTLLIRSPRYDGFKRVGDDLKCAACGHEFANEAEVPFKVRKAVKCFDESDMPAPVRVFRDDEKGKTCAYCTHYVVNPFTQRCGLRFKEVEATDSCDDFAAKEAPSSPQ